MQTHAPTARTRTFLSEPPEATKPRQGRSAFHQRRDHAAAGAPPARAARNGRPPLTPRDGRRPAARDRRHRARVWRPSDSEEEEASLRRERDFGTRRGVGVGERARLPKQGRTREGLAVRLARWQKRARRRGTVQGPKEATRCL